MPFALNTVNYTRLMRPCLVFADGKIDIIIVEDDPYYFLQMAPYAAKFERRSKASTLESDKWISNLSPSYLK